MGWRIKVRRSAKDKWQILPGVVFETKEEAESFRELGQALTGDEVEVVCEECTEPVTAKFSRVQHAG